MEQKMKKFQNQKVAAVFKNYPKNIRPKLMFLRQLIFDTAATTAGVGDLEETLKWGEPAYLTSKTKSGSTIRIDWKKDAPHQYAMYFHCQTSLVETFKTIYPKVFVYVGNRAITFGVDDKVRVKELTVCIAAALTYHLKQKM